MIIHKPEIMEEGDEIIVSSKVEFKGTRQEFPDRLWYKFPKSYREYVTSRTDGFVTSLLPLAMTLGENLEIRGTVSSRLAQGLREFRFVQSTWKPNHYKFVEINYEELCDASIDDNIGVVGSAFSGGVDSFHTLWSHLPQNEPYQDYVITHCLLINGFERVSDIENTGRFLGMQKTYEEMMAANGLNLIVSTTNIREFLDAPRLKQSFGAIVTASALVLGRLFSVFYIPSSYKFTELKMIQDGSHLMLDNLLCTESLQTIHDGAHFSRVEKTVAISQWADAFSRLRVCFNATVFNDATSSIENCCRCEKCIRTMATLDMCGALHNFSAFPAPLTRWAIRVARYESPGSRLFARELIEYALECGRKDVAFDYRYALLRGRFWLELSMKFHRFSAWLQERSNLYCRFIKLVKQSG